MVKSSFFKNFSIIIIETKDYFNELHNFEFNDLSKFYNKSPGFFYHSFLLLLTIIMQIINKNPFFSQRIWPFILLYHSVVFFIQFSLTRGYIVCYPKHLLIFSLLIIYSFRSIINTYRRSKYKLSEEHSFKNNIQEFINNKKLVNIIALFFTYIQVIIGYLLISSISLIKDTPIQSIDVLLLMVFFLFFLISFKANEQKYQFLRKKQINTKNDTDIIRGFLTKGVFAFSRNPEYLGEIGLWYTMYTISCINDLKNFFNWTCFGSISYNLILFILLMLKEIRYRKLYPEYKIYQLSTNILIPWFPSNNYKLD